MANRGPIWFTPAKNVRIYGVGIGLVNFGSEEKRSTINGVGIELGIGILAYPWLGTSMSQLDRGRIAEADTAEVVHQLNGINIGILGAMVGGQVNGLSVSGSMGFVDRMNGLMIAPAGCINYELNGVAIGGVLFCDAHRVHGAQIAFLANSANELQGAQIGLFNGAKKIHGGVQIGLINKAKNLKGGVQIGLYNRADKLEGLQIGLINRTASRMTIFFHRQK
jgi:hypothetical protein